MNTTETVTNLVSYVTGSDVTTKADLFNFESLTDVLPQAGVGWLGVFIVTAVIVATVYLLNAFGSRNNK